MVRQAGITVWWPGWFGGLDLPTYSCLTPTLMAVLGAPLTGALAALVSIAVMNELLKSTLRPVAASSVFALIIMCNLFGGRITFLVGTAIGLGAALALARNRPVVSASLGVLACLASPLAGLFLGISAVALALTNARLRQSAIVLSGALAATAGVLYVLFSGAGVMPTPEWQMLLSITAVLIVAAVCPSPTVRIGCVLLVMSLVLAMTVPTAVGLNMTRMVWLLAATMIVAYARTSTVWVASLMALTVLFPIVDASQQVTTAQNASAREAFYQPLLAQLKLQSDQNPASLGQRVEVLEPRTKGAARYVAMEVPIARGWDRQADRAHNELFYNEDELLNPASYHAWLDEMAVGWVAVPTAPLDHASKGEKQLIEAGLPYLERVWTTEDWQLYRVTTAKALAPGAVVLENDHGEITLRVPEPGAYPIQIRWSRHLQVDPTVPSIAQGPESGACLAKAGDWTVLHVPAAGDYTIASDFKPLPFGGTDSDTCLRVGSS